MRGRDVNLKTLLRPMEGFCYCTRLGMEESYLASVDVLTRRVVGAFVECGVASGGMAACMAMAMIETDESRTFHLFDSFAGIPIAGPKDDCQPGVNGGKIADDSAPLRERLRPSGIGPAVCAEEVQRNLTDIFGLSAIDWRLHAGWFQDTLPAEAAGIGPIALLHLDGDLYESTLVCLEWLYPLVSPGALVIVDDYELKGCRRAVLDYFRAEPVRLRRFADYGSTQFTKFDTAP